MGTATFVSWARPSGGGLDGVCARAGGGAEASIASASQAEAARRIERDRSTLIRGVIRDGGSSFTRIWRSAHERWVIVLSREWFRLAYCNRPAIQAGRTTRTRVALIGGWHAVASP